MYRRADESRNANAIAFLLWAYLFVLKGGYNAVLSIQSYLHC